ncbi:MAG: thiamine pyrophosphate-dependent dehydrogenase E1 component subunit alpha [Chloroflexota bacterium]|nr:thiamine pyrophosphate-dependent dehydrogenase E1 component subunit alpha [Chloroflexota bacterium]
MQQAHPAPAGIEPLGPEDLLDLYAAMVRVRALDERVWILNRQGKAAIVASCQGHEAAQLGSVWALRKHAAAHFCFTYYRDMGVCVAQGLTMREVMLGFLAKEGEPISRARQFPLHGADVGRGFMNLSNVVGSHVPEAVGWALAAKLRREPTVTAVYLGDGAASQGDIHESMNFASVHNLPVLFLVENNGYAISVPLHKQMAIDRVAERAAAYGMPGVTVDGTDVAAAYAATAQAVQRAAGGGGPSLVEFDVERYLPHTSDDDDSTYRSRDEVEEGKKRDPLAKLQQRLLAEGVLTPERNDELRKAARREVDEATDAAEAAPYPGAADVLDHLYAADGR